MQFKNTIQAMQKLGANVVKEGRSILKKKKKQTSGNTLYNDFDYLVTASDSSVTSHSYTRSYSYTSFYSYSSFYSYASAPFLYYLLLLY